MTANDDEDDSFGTFVIHSQDSDQFSTTVVRGSIPRDYVWRSQYALLYPECTQIGDSLGADRLTIPHYNRGQEKQSLWQHHGVPWKQTTL